MQLTQHADKRMNQRGISRRLMEFAVRHGRVDGDKLILDRKESLRLIEALNVDIVDPSVGTITGYPSGKTMRDP